MVRLRRPAGAGMTGFMRRYVRIVDGFNRRIGRITMYGIFVLAGVLLWSSISKVISDEPFRWLDAPADWTLETAQFAMVAYYILGGPYSIQMGSNVRMDLFYSEWSPRRKAWFDAFSVMCLMFFLGVLFHGGVDSAAYALGYYGKEPYGFFGDIVVGFLTGGPDGAEAVMGRAEHSATAWRPPLWPIKLIMCFGILMMLLQAVSELFKDIATLRGETL